MVFLDILFPPVCGYCKQPGAYLCKKCKSTLQPYTEVCSLCNRYSQDYRICPSCKKQNNFALTSVIIGFYYDSIIKKCILDLKYRHRYYVSDFLAKRLSLLMQTHLPQTITAQNTVIMGIPSHWWRKYMIKGYNQSEMLARMLAKNTGFEYISAIKKIKNTQSQVKLNKQQRMQNLKDSFVFKSGYSGFPDTIKNIIIIDDITTTGSSLNVVAKTIKKRFPDLDFYGIVVAKK